MHIHESKMLFKWHRQLRKEQDSGPPEVNVAPYNYIGLMQMRATSRYTEGGMHYYTRTGDCRASHGAIREIFILPIYPLNSDRLIFVTCSEPEFWTFLRDCRGRSTGISGLTHAPPSPARYAYRYNVYAKSAPHGSRENARDSIGHFYYIIILCEPYYTRVYRCRTRDRGSAAADSTGQTSAST